jgi:hypothetical protein
MTKHKSVTLMVRGALLGALAIGLSACYYGPPPPAPYYNGYASGYAPGYYAPGYGYGYAPYYAGPPVAVGIGFGGYGSYHRWR